MNIFREDGTSKDFLNLFCESVCSVIYEMTKLCPEFELNSLRFLEEFDKTIGSSSKLQAWTLKFFRLSVMQNKKFDMSNDGNWDDLSLIPQADEMMGTPLENDTHLSPVKKDKPYKSSEEYMDTYFRLLRTECFASMQQGIKSLLSGELDERDMRVYYNVRVAGFRVARSSFNIGVRFETIQPVR